MSAANPTVNVVRVNALRLRVERPMAFLGRQWYDRCCGRFSFYRSDRFHGNIPKFEMFVTFGSFAKPVTCRERRTSSTHFRNRASRKSGHDIFRKLPFGSTRFDFRNFSFSVRARNVFVKRSKMIFLKQMYIYA